MMGFLNGIRVVLPPLSPGRGCPQSNIGWKTTQVLVEGELLNACEV